jgi:hypothetical protein
VSSGHCRRGPSIDLTPIIRRADRRPQTTGAARSSAIAMRRRCGRQGAGCGLGQRPGWDSGEDTYVVKARSALLGQPQMLAPFGNARPR